MGDILLDALAAPTKQINVAAMAINIPVHNNTNIVVSCISDRSKNINDIVPGPASNGIASGVIAIFPPLGLTSSVLPCVGLQIKRSNPISAKYIPPAI